MDDGVPIAGTTPPPPDAGLVPIKPAARLPVVWWTAGLAVVGVFGLLVAFDRVVRQGVLDGGLRKDAVQARAKEAWRCNSLPQAQDRAKCRQGLMP